MQDTVSDDGGKRKRKRKKKTEAEMGDMESMIYHDHIGPPPTLEPAAPDWAPSPQPFRKIAVLGSAVSSVGLAPFGEPAWEIWACSPANKGLPRVDVWFELHNPEVKIREGLTEWLDWLKEKPIVYMQKAYPGYKGAREFPLQQLMERWGPFWWTSQLAFMLALAIEQKPSHIGIYGVDMAANSEYNQQRLACQYFIQHIVRNTDIQLSVPPESDILEPAPLYGYCESSRQWRKHHARQLELAARIRNLEAEVNQKASEKAHLVGAADNMEYILAHWSNRMDFQS